MVLAQVYSGSRKEMRVNRTLGIERIYRLGDYENLKVTDNINDLPEELMFKGELINKIRYLQLLNVELASRKYHKLMESMYVFSYDEQIEALSEEKLNTLDEIKQLLNKE